MLDISFEPNKLSPLERVKQIIDEATTALMKMQPLLFFAAFIVNLASRKNNPTESKELTVTGIDDPKLAQEISQGVMHYLSKIEGGQKILDDAFKTRSALTLHFGKVEGSGAQWDHNENMITVEYFGDFEKLKKLLFNPLPVHEDTLNALGQQLLPSEDPCDALDSILFEFRNAGVDPISNDPLTFRVNTLIFKSAKDYGLFTEYCEFNAQTGGAEMLISRFKGGITRTKDFNEWYQGHSTIVSDYFKEAKTHTGAYEEEYNKRLKCFIRVIEIMTKAVVENDDISKLKFGNEDLDNLLNKHHGQKPLAQALLFVDEIKKCTCSEVQKELDIASLEAAIAQASKRKDTDNDDFEERTTKRQRHH